MRDFVLILLWVLAVALFLNRFPPNHQEEAL